MKKVLAGLLGALALTTSAMAADMAPMYRKAPPAPIWSWTGSYVGGYVGGAWADPSTSVPLNAAGVLLPGLTTPASYDLGATVIAGVTSGYNYQFSPNWLIGYESETGYIHMHGSGLYPGTATGATGALGLGDIYSVFAARFGYIWDSKSLIYVKGGAAYTRFESSVFNAPNTLNLGGHKNEWGYAIGGGWEYAFAPKWTVKAEYLYLGFDNSSLGINGIANGIRGAVTQEFASTTLPGIHTVKVGINYKWDWFGMFR